MFHPSLASSVPSSPLARGTTLVARLPVLTLCALLLAPAVAQGPRADVAAELRRLERAGAPLLPEDLERPALAAQDNGADAFLAAFEKLPEMDWEKEDALEAFTRDDNFGPAAEDDWRRAQPAIEELLAARNEALDAAVEACAQPALRFPIELALGLKARLGHLSPCQHLSELLTARALLRARTGDVPGALRDAEAGLRIAGALQDEPFLVSHLVMIAVVGRWTTVLREVCAAEVPQPEELGRLREAAAALDPGPSLQRALDGERVWGLRAFAEAVDKEIASAEEAGGVELTALERHFAKDKRLYLSFHREARALLEEPYDACVAALDSLQKEVAATCRDQKLPMTGLLLPGLSRAVDSHAKLRTELTMLGTALDLLSGAAETGRYALDLPGEPRDVQSGELLRCKHKGLRIELYAPGLERAEWTPDPWVLPLPD